MNNRLLFFSIIFSTIITGCSQTQQIRTSEQKPRVIKNSFPTVLGDTSSSAIPPPDFVEYSIEPKVINRVDPIYPEDAKEDNLEGNVFVKCWVSKDGIVRRSVILKSDNRVFNQSALEASLQWRFEPAKMSDGTAADVWVSIPFRFRLN